MTAPTLDEIVARAAELLADAVASAGVRVTPVYSVTCEDGERRFYSSFQEALDEQRRIAAGGRAA
jgi:hypothetical protein